MDRHAQRLIARAILHRHHNSHKQFFYQFTCIFFGSGTNAQVRVTGNNATGLDIIQGGDSTGYVWLRDNNDLLFGTNDTTRMRILAGGGLTFGGDTAAANALDDYEEGTLRQSLNRAA